MRQGVQLYSITSLSFGVNESLDWPRLVQSADRF